MKKKLIVFVLVFVFGLSLVPVAKAIWQRLDFTDDNVCYGGVCVYIVYDKLEKVNCYIAVSDQFALNENRSNSIHCIKLD